VPARPAARPAGSESLTCGALLSDDRGQTTIAGPIADQAALHGLLARIRDLGLELRLVRLGVRWASAHPDLAVTGRLQRSFPGRNRPAVTPAPQAPQRRGADVQTGKEEPACRD
jgi:hypothetical protein